MSELQITHDKYDSEIKFKQSWQKPWTIKIQQDLQCLKELSNRTFQYQQKPSKENTLPSVTDAQPLSKNHKGS